MEHRDQFSEFDNDAPSGPIVPLDEPITAQPEDMVPKSRLDEVRAQRDQLHGQREEMIQSMLSGAPQAKESTEEAPQQESPLEEMTKVVIPEGTDPEVAQLLTPILEANNKAVYGRLAERVEKVDSRVAPVAERINYADMVDGVASRVEGFEAVRKDIVNMLEQMEPSERERYNSEIGLESLAQRALREREALIGQRADMAHSAPFGASETRPRETEAHESDVWALSDQEFERALARKGMSL